MIAYSDLVAIKVGIMKAQILIVFMIISSICLLSVDASGPDVKRVEERMSKILGGLDSWNHAIEKEKTSESQSNFMPANPLVNLSALNSTSINSSAKSSNASVSVINTTDEEKLTPVLARPSSAALDKNGSADLQGVGTSSKANFNGYYGVTASKHEVGKSDIKSKIFLSGTFTMDKTVKFSDQGF
jgi:hypothetical protein